MNRDRAPFENVVGVKEDTNRLVILSLFLTIATVCKFQVRPYPSLMKTLRDVCHLAAVALI